MTQVRLKNKPCNLFKWGWPKISLFCLFKWICESVKSGDIQIALNVPCVQTSAITWTVLGSLNIRGINWNKWNVISILLQCSSCSLNHEVRSKIPLEWNKLSNRTEWFEKQNPLFCNTLFFAVFVSLKKLCLTESHLYSGYKLKLSVRIILKQTDRGKKTAAWYTCGLSTELTMLIFNHTNH